MVVDCLPELPPDAEILSLSADGGALLHRLLARHPRARATVLDLTTSRLPALSAWAERTLRIRWHGASQLTAWRKAWSEKTDVVILSDVLHHVHPERRAALLEALRPALGEEALFVVKEFAPDGARGAMARLVDGCLSGDPRIRFLPPYELRSLVARVFPDLVAYETPLQVLAPPNYCAVFGRLARLAA